MLGKVLCVTQGDLCAMMIATHSGRRREVSCAIVVRYLSDEGQNSIATVEDRREKGGMTMADEKPERELICARCRFPIRSGTLYAERQDGQPVHWRCSGLAQLTEESEVIGTGE